MNDDIQSLRNRLAEVADLSAAASLLEWDMEVMMPPKAAESRGQQAATLSARIHRERTAPELGELLARLESADLDDDHRAFVREARHDYDKATALPEDFVRRLALARNEGYGAWMEARKKSDFARFRPSLKKLVDLAREEAKLLGYEDSPYDALLDQYERGMTTARLRPLFATLASEQKQLLGEIMASGVRPDEAWKIGTWERGAQEEVGRIALEAMGFDFGAGRLDTAPHPFCTNFGMNDVRLTTRYYDHDVSSALYSSLHEAGHGLYEQGFDPAWERTPLADAPGLGIHECNSRMWENVVGRSRAYTRFILSHFRAVFPDRLDKVSEEQWYAAANKVTPSLIRVEADECTYNLHVIIRFEIEADLIEGKIEVDDIPAKWNALYRDYLGIDVPNDADGCLQDVHWSHALFGYFPTYALGNLYAAQVFEVFAAEHPEFWDGVESGDMLVLREWLREKIHMVGRRELGPEIVERISGRAPEPGPYLDYLRKKYTPLYGLSGA